MSASNNLMHVYEVRPRERMIANNIATDAAGGISLSRLADPREQRPLALRTNRLGESQVFR